MRFSRFIVEDAEDAPTERKLLKGIKDGHFTVDGKKSVIDDDVYLDMLKLKELNGCPGTVKGNLYAQHNKIESLEGIGKYVYEIHGELNLNDNPVKSHVCGVLMIKGLTAIKLDNTEVEAIINKYLPNRDGMKAVRACQTELVDAGFDEFAKL